MKYHWSTKKCWVRKFFQISMCNKFMIILYSCIYNIYYIICDFYKSHATWILISFKVVQSSDKFWKKQDMYYRLYSSSCENNRCGQKFLKTCIVRDLCWCYHLTIQYHINKPYMKYTFYLNILQSWGQSCSNLLLYLHTLRKK